MNYLISLLIILLSTIFVILVLSFLLLIYNLFKNKQIKLSNDIVQGEIPNYEMYYTVGQLVKFIEENNIPKDAKILLQRVEDVYFDKHGWTTINKEGYQYNSLKTYYENKEFSKEDIEYLKEKYYVCWSPVKYENDDNLYLDAHY